MKLIEIPIKYQENPEGEILEKTIVVNADQILCLCEVPKQVVMGEKVEGFTEITFGPSLTFLTTLTIKEICDKYRFNRID